MPYFFTWGAWEGLLFWLTPVGLLWGAFLWWAGTRDRKDTQWPYNNKKEENHGSND